MHLTTYISNVKCGYYKTGSITYKGKLPRPVTPFLYQWGNPPGAWIPPLSE